MPEIRNEAAVAPEAIDDAARRNLAPLLEAGLPPDRLDPDADLASDYGLTSLNKVLFLTAVCEDTGIALAGLTEQDVARMRTLREVTALLSAQATGPGGTDGRVESEPAL